MVQAGGPCSKHSAPPEAVLVPVVPGVPSSTAKRSFMQAKSVGERKGQHRCALCVAVCHVWVGWDCWGGGSVYIHIRHASTG